MAVISFKDFSFKYENLKQPTLKNINLEIQPGEKVLIAGPSGSGKSTLAHCINGLIPFTYKGNMTGTLTIDGIKPYEKTLYEVSEHVGTILQDQDGQFVGLSVGEDVAFSYENNKVPQDKMIEGVNTALSQVEMLEFINESPHSLSGGQKQKVSLAGILASDAPILLFDEPLANLDPISGEKAMKTINHIHSTTKKTIIIIEHRIEDVLEHDFNRIIIVNNGEIVADDSPDVILAEGRLSEYGLREPLYIEVLRKIGAPIGQEKQLSDINNSIKFKDLVTKAYKDIKIPVEALKKDKLLSIQNISYKYPGCSKDVLKDISFDIYEGEMLAVLGNNGAGKSTLMKIITGIAKQQSGKIIYKGEDISKASIRKRADIIGYVMQNPNHMITKNMIYDEIAFGLRNFGYDENKVKERTEEVLKACGLYAYRNWPVSSLSYGQKKRVTIASILAMKPQILIIDEPTAGQDYRNYKEFMNFIENIKHTGVSIIMITHDMHLAIEYADRAVVLSDGSLIKEDSVYNILSDDEVLAQANLKKTSISSMGELYGAEDVSSFLACFVSVLREEVDNEQI